MTDEELLLLVNHDPSKGIDVAMDTYGGAVLKICADILNGYRQEDIEEAVSDTFVNLWEAITSKRYSGQTPVKFYLYGIARRTASNRKRKEAKKPVCDDLDEVTVMDTENVEDKVMERTECELVRCLIERMKSPDKEVFHYRYYEQLPVKEIAQKLLLKPKKVENILFRGKEALKRQLLILGF